MIELRRPRPEPSTPSAEDEYLAEPEPEEAMTVQALHDALKRLTARQRFVVELRTGVRDGHAYTVLEIADMMGITQQAVSKHYELALAALRRMVVLTPPTEHT